ncbi:SdpI family protein [Lentilactobacillus raoultii]|uniref:SdpI family protein n=1 Tax=Lentilactobacillus raoultii TaxID=1987503 RepID=A0ABW3PM42_9LACO
MRSLFVILFVALTITYLIFKFLPYRISRFVGFRMPFVFHSQEDWSRGQTAGYSIILLSLAVLIILNYLIKIPAWLNFGLLIILISITVIYIGQKVNK